MTIEIAEIISIILGAVGVLVVLCNIITEVLKKIFWDTLPTNILAVIVSMVLTLLAFFAWTACAGINPIPWYYLAGAVVLGFLVAYAAMFGYDKLKEILDKLKG